MFVFLYEYIVSGGAETLIMRLGRNGKKRGLETKVYCTHISDQMKRQYEENLIQIEMIRKWRLGSVIQSLSDDDIVFTFSLRDFLTCESYAQEKNKRNWIYLYILNPKVLCIERLGKLGIGKDFLKKRLKNEIYRFIDNGRIIFIDEMCIKWTEQFFLKKIENPKEKIYRIPAEDITWDEERFQKIMHKRKKDFQILTIARADFPFKAYMKGLIEDFTILKKEYETIKLKIVSYGPDIEELRKWISEAYKNGADDIKLVGETQYDLLDEFYKDSNLFIGMGTTLLDATKYGIISLNALMHSYQLKCTGFFHEYPYCLGVEQECCQDALEKIREAVCYSDEEYERYARASRKLFLENYLIDVFIDRILSHKTRVEHRVSFAIRKIIKFIKSPIIIKMRLKTPVNGCF